MHEVVSCPLAPLKFGRSAVLAQAVGRMTMLMPESLMCEGWVQKESRLLLEWRTRWLVLYRDHVSQLPVLCTFKEARCDWDLAAMPEPTERIDLVGCSCGIQADPSSSTKTSPSHFRCDP